MSLSMEKRVIVPVTAFFMLLIASELPAAAVSERVPHGWAEVRTAHFSFRFHPRTRKQVQQIIDASEGELGFLKKFLGIDSVEEIEVRVAKNTQEMKAIKPGQQPPEWATGMAMRGERLVLLSLTPPGGGKLVGLRELFLHELVHILMYDATRRTDLPIWFNEGIAIHLSGEFSFARHRTLTASALQGDLLPLSQLDRNYPPSGRMVNIAYAQSADLVKFLSERYGKEGSLIPDLLERLRRGDEFQPALESLCKRSLKQVENEWMQSLNMHYKWVPSVTGGGALWGIITLLLLFSYFIRRRRARERLRRMEIEEEFFARGRRGPVIESGEAGKIPMKTEDHRRVYHDGKFYNLH